MTLHERIKTLKIPYGVHCSDLYIPVNEETKKLIEEYEYKGNVTIFISNIDGQRWFDVPFANDDYKRG